jgi:hypothetical protein
MGSELNVYCNQYEFSWLMQAVWNGRCLSR